MYIQKKGVDYETEKRDSRNDLCLTLLTAIAILIPSIMPIKLIIPPASYTLSHVPIFLAMFISPWVATFVILASSLGFFMAGYPIVIVLGHSRISSLVLGALYLKKFLKQLKTRKHL